MGWLFGQVWVLCVIAFLAGAAVTWLAFVRPQRGAVHSTVAGTRWTPKEKPNSDWESAHAAARALTGAAPAPAPPAGPPVDPALSAIDDRNDLFHRVGPGATATGALDQLGVARPEPPDIPAQAGPPGGDGEGSTRTS